MTDWNVNGRQARVANRFESGPWSYDVADIQVTYDLAPLAEGLTTSLSVIDAYNRGAL